MALQPSLRFTRFGTGAHTLEIYLDLICPFSAKCSRFLSSYLIPQVLAGGKYAGVLSILIRPYPQPWHAASSNVSEASIAFGKALCSTGKETDSALWLKYWDALMRNQEKYFAIPIKDTTSEQVRDQMAILAGQVAESEKWGPSSKAAEQVRELLTLKGSDNAGNAVSADLKYFVKLGRQNAIHVTPSAVFNGIFDSSVSSSWLEPEWTKYLSEKGL